MRQQMLWLNVTSHHYVCLFDEFILFSSTSISKVMKLYEFVLRCAITAPLLEIHFAEHCSKDDLIVLIVMLK